MPTKMDKRKVSINQPRVDLYSPFPIRPREAKAEPHLTKDIGGTLPFNPLCTLSYRRNSVLETPPKQGWRFSMPHSGEEIRVAGWDWMGGYV
jgi:hypothetical protein